VALQQLKQFFFIHCVEMSGLASSIVVFNFILELSSEASFLDFLSPFLIKW
jgi:hypothetical protein